eukprot:m.230811 g.230811  ORF g.230811 m.230811 type:complete len:66 (+) comp18155_c0_seq1:945-1142(+)
MHGRVFRAPPSSPQSRPGSLASTASAAPPLPFSLSDFCLPFLSVDFSAEIGGLKETILELIKTND